MAGRSKLQAQANRSVAWIGAASGLVGFLDLISNLICLWLWVSPSEFGAATLAIALFPILDRLGQLGLGAAAIQRVERRPRDLSSIFWLGLITSSTVAAALLLSRPLLAGLFPHPVVAALLCAYGGKLVWSNLFTLVPEALMKHQLRYRELSLIRVAAMAADTAAKLTTAYLGAHGHPPLRIWCFVVGPLAGALVTGVAIQLRQRWRPRGGLRPRVALAAARFGASLAGAEMLYFLYTSADYLVVGAAFGDAAVGIYRLAYELVIDVVRLVSMVTAEIAFPLFTRLRSSPDKLADEFVRFTRQNLIALAPFLAFVAVAADDLLAVLYPPLGPAAATAARIMCIVGGLRALSFVVPPMLAGVGYPSVALVYNLVAAVALPLGFVASAHVLGGLGYVSVAWAWAAIYPVAFAVLLALALPRIGLPVSHYLRAAGGVLACAAGAGAAGELVRALMPATPLLRAGATAVVIAGTYLLLIAQFQGVTARAVWRSFRET